MKSDIRIEGAIKDTGRLSPDEILFHGIRQFCYRYDMDWLIRRIDEGADLSFVTFWKADPGVKNNVFSQWYAGFSFTVNRRVYQTAEQYMMSEKALLFGDLDSYRRIMDESDPAICKKLGRGVSGFSAALWEKSFREILFSGNRAKFLSDPKAFSALMATGDAVLIEASPYDDKYGAGMTADTLLDSSGKLLIPPQNWHKEGSSKRAENHLGFVLMGLRDMFQCMKSAVGDQKI